MNANDAVALQRYIGTNASTSNSSFAPATVESGPEIRLEQGRDSVQRRPASWNDARTRLRSKRELPSSC